MDSLLLPCDGCGQLADSAHISRRLGRLAWATRFRPVHIQALLLSGVSPNTDSEFLYAPASQFQGEAASVLKGVQISTEGKAPESIQYEFQKLGLLLVHVLECPLDASISESEKQALIEKQLPATLARIRRSLKPKRVVLLSADLQAYADRLRQADLGCPVLPEAGSLFLSGSGDWAETELAAFGKALGIAKSSAV